MKKHLDATLNLVRQKGGSVMEFLLNFLLNYMTLSVAGIAFVLILAVLI